MNVAYNMDCMEFLRQQADKSFDLAACDPPYGLGVQSMTYTKEGAENKRYGNSCAKRRDYKRSEEWDVKPPKEYFDELFRVSKSQIIFGGNYFSDILPPSRSFIVWDKRCKPEMTNSFADCEYAWMSSDLGVARVFRYIWNGMLQGNPSDGMTVNPDKSSNEQRFHATQKPIALYRWIYKNYAKPGMRILDTHLGSGSSRIAAYDAGLDFVGCEIDKDYFEAQERRFEAYTAQQSLFIDYVQEEMSNGSN